MTCQLSDVCICSKGVFNFNGADWFIGFVGKTDDFATQKVNKLCASLLLLPILRPGK